MPVLRDADDRLRGWLGPVAGGASVRADPPGDDWSELTVTAYLLGLEPTTKVGGDAHRPSPVVLRLRYLVCADGPDRDGALDLLDTVLTAAFDAVAIDGHRLDVDLEPLPPEAWLALRARPRPVITLRLDAQHVRAAEVVPMVREPLTLLGSTIRSLSGRLVGPDDVPLVGAEVTLTATGVADRTSSGGTFTFPTVPAGPGPVRLSIRTKGRMFTADVDADVGEPIVVRCDLLKG